MEEGTLKSERLPMSGHAMEQLFIFVTECILEPEFVMVGVGRLSTGFLANILVIQIGKGQSLKLAHSSNASKYTTQNGCVLSRNNLPFPINAFCSTKACRILENCPCLFKNFPVFQRNWEIICLNGTTPSNLFDTCYLLQVGCTTVSANGIKKIKQRRKWARYLFKTKPTEF